MATPLAGPSVGTAPRRRGRGTIAVVAGLLVNVVLGLGIDQILHATGVYPPWGQTMSDSLFGLATAYRVLIGILGGYVTARLAPDRPMRHAIALGIVGVVVSTAGLVATWNAGPAFGPRWYPILLVLVAIPCSWLGAKLQAGGLRKEERSPHR
jgi:peptidoglycan/LPS O-acetylase OafA/YrhL